MHAAASLLLWASAVSAHFSISYPAGGKNTPNQNDGPCGGQTLDLSKDDDFSDFHVDGDAVALMPTHSQQNWLLRAKTAGDDAEWVQLHPIFSSVLGSTCIPSLSVPSNWTGQSGVIGVVASAEDGFLYNCVAVKFVEGSIDDKPDKCRNTTSEEASFTSDDKLAKALNEGCSNKNTDSKNDDDDDNSSDDGNGAESLYRPTLWTVAGVVGLGLATYL